MNFTVQTTTASTCLYSRFLLETTFELPVCRIGLFTLPAHFVSEQVKGDGDPICFSSLDDTGVPELQEWCKKLTVASRERGARNFRNHLRVFATSVKTYVESFGTVSESDRTSLRDQWQTKMASRMEDGGYDDDRDSDSDNDDPYDLGNTYKKSIDKAYALDDDEPDGISGKLAKVRLSFKLRMLDLSNSILQDLTFVVADCVKEMQEAFKEGLEDKCKLGAEYVSVMQC